MSKPNSPYHSRRHTNPFPATVKTLAKVARSRFPVFESCVFNWHYAQCVLKRFSTADYLEFNNFRTYFRLLLSGACLVVQTFYSTLSSRTQRCYEHWIRGEWKTGSGPGKCFCSIWFVGNFGLCSFRPGCYPEPPLYGNPGYKYDRVVL